MKSVIKASEKNRQRAPKANELCFTAIFVFQSACLTVSVSACIIPGIVHLSVRVKGAERLLHSGASDSRSDYQKKGGRIHHFHKLLRDPLTSHKYVAR